MAGKLFIISAPSGSGKSTLVGELRRHVDNLDFSISYTTRAPRGSEQNGREYYFIERAQFEAMIERNAFLEHAQVFGNYYGTACESVDHAKAAGKDLILDIDIQGAKQVLARMPEAVSIFIAPPSPVILESRLRNRSSAEDRTSHVVTPDEVILKRLAQARIEMEQMWNYRFVLINDELEHALSLLRSIVLCERGSCDEAEQRESAACSTLHPSTKLAHVLAQFGLRLPGAPGASSLNPTVESSHRGVLHGQA